MVRATIGFLLVCVFSLTTAPLVHAQTASDRIAALLARYHELGLFNGSVLVADRGEVVVKEGVGLANMEWNIANAPDTKFRLGSITKQFTAVLVLQMVEQGRIDLQAPITRYLPDYPAQTGDRITIHHLLNHTSGIPGYTEIPTFGETVRNRYTPTQFIEFFSNLDLLFEPGTKYSYNNSAYFLLGVILEKVTGQSYEMLLRERIFSPLGMNDSGYDSTTPLLAKRAAGYDKRFDGSYVNTSFLDMSQPYAGGSLYSTVEDLHKWDQALLGEKVLTSKSKERMFTPGLSDYGYGWRITTRDGVTTIEHGGGINGFNTLITRNPDARRVIVLLNNTGGAPLGEIATGVRAILDGKAAVMPKQPAALTLYQTYQKSGLAAVLAQAKEMQAGTQYEAGRVELSQLAGHLLAAGQPADALLLAKKIAEDAPKSADTAVLLAQAHRANGNRIEAVQAYSRAIDLSETPRAFLIYTAAIRELSTLTPKEEK